jgi:hypothetical protein
MAIKEVPSASDKEISMKAMEGYKTLIEGPYRRLAAIICYAMIKAKKHHKYLEDKKSHAMPQSLAEVAKRDIGGMMAFMGAENHSVFTDKVNKTLRNAAGHENYKVEKDGSITYWDKTHTPQTISISELNDEIDSLVDLLYAMNTGLKVAVGVWFQHILKTFDTDDVAKR